MKLFALHLLLIALTVTAASCFEDLKPQSNAPSLTQAETGTAKIKSLNDGAERLNKAIVPHADPTGKELSLQVTKDHEAIATEADNVSGQLGETRTKLGEMTKIASDAKDDLKRERNHWIGFKTRVAAKVIIGVSFAVWLACGVLYAITAISPLGIFGKIVGEVASFLPAMNPFDWLRSYLSSRKAAPTA